MNKKDGTQCTLVEPDAPVEPEEACDAEPGEAMETAARQREAQPQEFGASTIDPMATGEETAEEGETHWVGVELKDAAGNPIPEEQYRVKLPDGTIRTGYLDEEGKAREDGIPTGGQCEVNFPRLHGDDWRPC